MAMSRRPKKKDWIKLRGEVWLRDGKKCIHCHKVVSLRRCHIDHIKPVSRGGNNRKDNLRTLCRYCHVLRFDNRHRGMIAKALQDGVIPPNWRELVWE
jgi:5-methylcytosine-specific restriction endonuclease McrA